MRGYVLSPRAQADIDEIWEYSADRRHIDQANRYVSEIRRAIEVVAGDPWRGRHATTYVVATEDIRQVRMCSFFELLRTKLTSSVSCTEARIGRHL